MSRVWNPLASKPLLDLGTTAGNEEDDAPECAQQ